MPARTAARIARALAAAAWMAFAACGPAAAAAPRHDCPPPLQPPDPAQVPALTQAARDHGALWRLRKDGRVSYLFGTVHVGRLEWLFPGPALQQALRATDTLALELDLLDPALPQRVQRYLAALPPLPLDAALQQRLAVQRQQACADDAGLAGQHPVLQALTLEAKAAQRLGLYAEYAQEGALAGIARSAQRPLVALETVEQQMAVLIPARPEDQREVLDGTLQLLEQGKAAPLLQRLAALWAEGRIDELGRYEDWCDCVHGEAEREQLRRLNDDRNPGFAQRIDALHAAGYRVFAAVGALHMTGPKALPALMAARGYQVERVRFPPAATPP